MEGPLHARLCKGCLCLRWGMGGSQHHRGTQQRPRWGWGQLVGVTPLGGPGPAGTGLPAEPGAPCRTWGWASGTGAPHRDGVSAHGRWSPLTSQLPSLPPSALLPPTQVVLTVALERRSVSPPPPDPLPGNLRPSHEVTGHSKSHLAAAFPWGLANTQWSLGRSWPRCQWAGTLGPRLEIAMGLI